MYYVINSFISINSNLKYSNYSCWLFSEHQEPGSNPQYINGLLGKKKINLECKAEVLKKKEGQKRFWAVRKAAKAVVLTSLVHHIPPHTFCFSLSCTTVFWNRGHLLIVILPRKSECPVYSFIKSIISKALLKQNGVTLLTYMSIQNSSKILVFSRGRTYDGVKNFISAIYRELYIKAHFPWTQQASSSRR